MRDIEVSTLKPIKKLRKMILRKMKNDMNIYISS